MCIVVLYASTCWVSYMNLISNHLRVKDSIFDLGLDFDVSSLAKKYIIHF